MAEGAGLISGFAVVKYLPSIIHTFNPGGSFSQSKLTLAIREMPEKQPTIGNLLAGSSLPPFGQTFWVFFLPHEAALDSWRPFIG